MLFSPFFLGLFSEKLVEEQPLDDDGLASQQSRGGDGGGGGSGGENKTTWEGEISNDEAEVTSVFLFID